MNQLRFPVAAALAGCVLAAGCAPKTAPPVERIYVDLAERPEDFPAGVLTGKRIVIDPGHGGSFAGAVGLDSLREADANLGVALYLWGLCADAGADAHLTRTTDRDRLPEGSTEARDDLDARSEAANELDPDVFISIHHNSNLALDRALNKIEAYYRSNDPGPSLELAQAVQVHLSRNLGIAAAEVKPGNYLVLRSSAAHAAVLGEASYLSHPLVENRLRLADKQKLEAQAYFLGLVDYFSRGVPSVERRAPVADTVAAPAELVFSVRGDAGVPLDPASARITIGASEVVPIVDPDTSAIRWPMDGELPNGPYAVQASVRSARGATGRSKPFTVLLNRPARHAVPLVPRPFGAEVQLSLMILDELAMPVADGTPVVLSAPRRGWKLADACRGGIARFTAERPPDAGDVFIVSAGAYSDTIGFPALDPTDKIGMLVIDARTRRPVPRPSAASSSFGSVAGDPRGALLLPRSAAGETLRVSARGYRAAAVALAAIGGGSPAAESVVELEPLYGGVLAGRRIAIDPGGGGAEPGGFGRRGLRGASVNLAIARSLRELLEEAGAEVALTREGEETLSAQERVYAANRSGAELAIGIRAGAAPGGTGGARLAFHYPGSARGRLAADSLAASLSTLPPGGAFAVHEGSSLFLQQTSCAAVEIYCGAVEDEATERLMEDGAWIRLAAERTLEATVRIMAAGK